MESIISQSYKDLEIILVDDGSTDGSGRICDDYAEKDKRVRVIHQENLCLSEARNRGLREAIVLCLMGMTCFIHEWLKLCII